VAYGSVFTTHRSQQKSEASCKQRAVLEETVFRKIYFIFAYAELSNVSQKELFTVLCCICRP